MEKKLYKNDMNKKVGGVCQGIAEYFSIDPLILRVLWFAAIWFYGVGLGLYVLLWVLLPDKSEVVDVLDKKDDFYKH